MNISKNDLIRLRRQGRYEEAFKYVSEIYSKEKNRFTALAFFWASDTLLGCRLKEKNTDEARHLLYGMIKAYPHIDDNELMANRKIVIDALKLDKLIPNFNITYFMPYFFKLPPRDWNDGRQAKGYWIPSLGQQVANRLMDRVPSADNEYVARVLPYFRTALAKNPTNAENLRHLAQLYVRTKLKSEAGKIYIRLLKNSPKSYLYAELAAITDDENLKICMLATAVATQQNQIFTVKWRYQLARLLRETMPERAAYEIRKSMEIRKNGGLFSSSDVERISRMLAEYDAVSEEEEQAFYDRCCKRVDKFIAGSDV